MEEKMLSYLQERLTMLKLDMDVYGDNDRIVRKDMDALIACKVMAEAVIGKPINLRMDGRVTVGI